MSTRLKFAIVGAGAIAQAYEAAFRDLPDIAVTAVCDVRKDAAAAMAQRAQCTSYNTVESLLKRADFDAAVVCTPPSTHEAIAVRLLEAGKHVLCEKPLSTTVQAAWRMLDAASRGKALLTMASKFRYVEDVRKARALVEAGTVGELVCVETAFTARVDMRQRWNSNPAVSGGGVLIDNGTHAVDILRYFMGNLRDVQIIEGRRPQGLSVEDTVRLFVHNDDGVMGSSDLSWSIDKELGTYLRVYGADGTILVGWKESKYRLRGESEWHVFGNGYNKVQAFRDQIDNFTGAILGTQELIITQRDALASVEVIRAAYAALKRTQWERVGAPIEELEAAPTAIRAVEAR
ncbi:MAG TPA: Gfo/Idh/MocA family oxidoreductase [Candidatus Baltobacteraceae bacterium]|nr:Gfo/Idh/MocA family oxidoreductase [Candidatus Baltobacteraceae bacterium]